MSTDIMYEKYIHAYESIPLSLAGIIMGLALIALHLFALLKPDAARALMLQAHKATLAGQVLLALCTLWFMMLLYDASWNPLRLELFEFDSMRGYLLIASPIIWFIFASMIKENLFGRALGIFLLMLLCLPLSAAFLKDPITRLLIPIWCYPVLTVALFWVAKPYLLRDWAIWLAARPRLMRYGAAAGCAYGLCILICAITLW